MAKTTTSTATTDVSLWRELQMSAETQKLYEAIGAARAKFEAHVNAGFQKAGTIAKDHGAKFGYKFGKPSVMVDATGKPIGSPAKASGGSMGALSV